MSVLEISSMDDFKKAVNAAGSKLIVIDCFATWCGPCKMIAPKIAEMAGKNTDVVFMKVDVDEVEEFATEYEISAMPTFIFMKDGKKIEEATVIGANEMKVKEAVATYK